jgi:hypothetical protein
MQLSTRYGLVGIGALALLTTVHQLRERMRWSSPAGDYLLGTLPNFAAAIAITLVLLSIWTDQKRAATFATIKRWFLVSASISVLGLFAWEAIQKTSNRFVFDLSDMGATVLGTLAATLLFYVVTPPARRST